MTTRKFWEILRKEGRGKFGVEKDGGYVREKRTRVCPVSFVANKVLKKKVYRCAIESPALDMELDTDFAEKVAMAADNDFIKCGILQLNNINTSIKRCRRHLLEVLGLKS